MTATKFINMPQCIQLLREAAELGQTRTLRSGGHDVPSTAPSSETHGKELSTETPVLTEQNREKTHHDTSDHSEAFRASTPLEASSQEPDTSRVGHAQRWSQWYMEDARVEMGRQGTCMY